ncbi:MAG: enolase C-terminal domain-like protein [Acetobacteraceae bacterium]
MTSDRARNLTLDFVQATESTCWTFLTLTTEDGLIGLGEATLFGAEALLAEGLTKLRRRALALPRTEPQALQAPTSFARLADAALHSALDQALWDVASQRSGLPLAFAIGGVRRASVPVYANINRRTRERSPAGFAASALAAVNAGFGAIKIAPFDEVDEAARESGGALTAARAGLERIAAVSEATAARAELYVDCHWRFDAKAADSLLRDCASLGVTWFECPIPETERAIPAIRSLRAAANHLGMRLAGGERLSGLSGFLPFVDGGAYDVMMPDIKHVGGIAEMLRIAERMAARGVAFSPHNPSGPVAHAASLHLSAAAPAIDRLELQWDESALFSALAVPPLPDPREGLVEVPLGRPGLGIALDHALAARYARLPQ